MAMVTSTLATVVRVIATMKAVNMIDQQTPDTQTTRGARNRLDQSAGPRKTVSARANPRALKVLRQKVTSKLRAASRWRVTTPAMLHSRVTKIIKKTARV